MTLSNARRLNLKRVLMMTTAVAATALPAIAQDQVADDVSTFEEITVVGTRLKGVSEEALPVTVMQSEQIENLGAVNMQDILSFIPSIGDFEFQDANTGTNGARGDVAGANLRGLGSGNTLVLLNGRRVVVHPTFQAINNVPVTFYNVNAIPSSSVSRVEVLRDGASALYGADATGGVVNFVPFTSYEGIKVTAKYGASDYTSYDEIEFTGRGGWRLNGGKTYVGIFATYYDRSKVEMAELGDLYFDLDRRAHEDIPEEWQGDSQLRNTSSITPWAKFEVGALDENGVWSGTAMSVDPETGEIRSGSHSARYNFNETAWATPSIKRYNLMANLTHELDNGIEFYADAFYYDSKSNTQRAASPIDSGLAYIIVPADATFNPFDEDVLITSWRPTDLGPRTIEVNQYTYRVSAGMRGEAYGWDWDSAVVYSEAEATDEEGNRQAKSLFQQQVAVDGANALNPFAGPGGNTEAALAGIRVSAVDVRRSTLTTWDMRLSKNDVMTVGGNDVGAAFGVEWRRESYLDDRDPRLDGSMPFDNGAVFDESDLIGVSATFDSSATRHTASAYGELSIPLVGPANAIAGIEAFELQIAARYENTSDFGDTFKPKFGFRYEPVSGFSFRGSYAKGFRAPNLAQMNQGTIIRRIQGIADPLREDVTDLPIDTGDIYRVTTRLGNDDLSPEHTDTYTLGAVWAPREGALSGLRLTFDWWQIEQDDVVGLLEPDDELELDALLRSQGSFNPNVTRAAVTATDIAFFDAWNAANPGDQREAVGVVTNIENQYINLDPRKVQGWDASFLYDTGDTEYGSVRLQADVSRITKFEQQGLATTDLLRRNGNPKWRATASLTWGYENFTSVVSMRYVSSVYDTSLYQSDTTGVDGTLDADAGRIYWDVDSWTTYNATIRYDFDEGGEFLTGTSLKVGVRNLTNKKPPFADESFGYLTSLHNSYGRIWWMELSKEF